MSDETKRPDERADDIESIPERHLTADQADSVKGGVGETTDSTLSDTSTDTTDPTIRQAWPKKYSG